jgi:hypothetical protein
VAATPASMRARVYALTWLAAVLLVLAFVLPPFAQPQHYHDFADQRGWLGIPNYGNVASNVMFLVVGLAGLMAMNSPALRAMAAAPRHAYAWMFVGLVFTAFGSAYYHWAPSDARLVWDRLPMAAVFMPLLAATYAERLRWRSEWPLLVLTLLGIGSVTYWKFSANLMPYLVAQGGSILLILLAMATLPTPWSGRGLLWSALACYAVAFASEKFDLAIFQSTRGVISGHTIKHLAAAAAFYFILQMLRQQRLKTDVDR